jgi:site-specific DNA-methyltransferase (adenine-specific)
MIQPTRIFTGRSTIRMYNCDCMELLESGKKWDLAIVDPPYGIGERLTERGGSHKNSPFATLYKKSSRWDILPQEQYWMELFRAVKNQIVFGANYFLEFLPSTRGFICWDKLQSMPTFSACELVWTSYDKPSKIFRIRSNDLTRFHPTQKPVKLYKWLLTNYAQPNQTILDTHGGSMSIAIACWDLGYDLDICELDTDYFNQAVKRFENHMAQQTLF